MQRNKSQALLEELVRTWTEVGFIAQLLRMGTGKGWVTSKAYMYSLANYN